MATARGRATTPVIKEAAPPDSPAQAAVRAARPGQERTVEERLLEEGFSFDFFQAVCLLDRLDSGRKPVGRGGPPLQESVRFRGHVALVFPPSSIVQIDRPTAILPMPALTVPFFGLFGVNGVLPRHYTELLLRLDREGKGSQKHALRDWLDLFNHRLISLFYRAWEKYRFYIPYARGEYAEREPDAFTGSLFSLIGLGERPLRQRLRVATRIEQDGEVVERAFARVDDLALLHYSGFLAHRPRSAAALEAMLVDYFQLPLRVVQFQGQWLTLDAANQSRLGAANCRPGLDLVAGARVWDVQGKIRLRLGPLGYADFETFIPERTTSARRKAFYLLCHLARLYVGPELDFDIQLVLRAAEVPECQLAGDCRLGWNTWVRSLPLDHDADDAVFAGEELVWVETRAG